jgi:hypothetical protein
MKTLELLKEALMTGQRLKSTIVRGQKPTNKQLLTTENIISDALTIMPEVNKLDAAAVVLAWRSLTPP